MNAPGGTGTAFEEVVPVPPGFFVPAEPDCATFRHERRRALCRPPERAPGSFLCRPFQPAPASPQAYNAALPAKAKPLPHDWRQGLCFWAVPLWLSRLQNSRAGMAPMRLPGWRPGRLAPTKTGPVIRIFRRLPQALSAASASICRTLSKWSKSTLLTICASTVLGLALPSRAWTAMMCVTVSGRPHCAARIAPENGCRSSNPF